MCDTLCVMYLKCWKIKKKIVIKLKKFSSNLKLYERSMMPNICFRDPTDLLEMIQGIIFC